MLDTSFIICTSFQTTPLNRGFLNWDEFLHHCRLAQAQTQKARGFTETNSPVIFSVSRVVRSASAPAVSKRAGHSSEKRLNLYPLLLSVGSALSWREKIKSKCVYVGCVCVCE